MANRQLTLVSHHDRDSRVADFFLRALESMESIASPFMGRL